MDFLVACDPAKAPAPRTTEQALTQNVVKIEMHPFKMSMATIGKFSVYSIS